MNKSLILKPRSATLVFLEESGDQMIRDIYLTMEVKQNDSNKLIHRFVTKIAKNTHKYALWEDSFNIAGNTNLVLETKCWELKANPILIGSTKLALDEELVNQPKSLNWIDLKSDEGVTIGELFLEIECFIKPKTKTSNENVIISTQNFIPKGLNGRKIQNQNIQLLKNGQNHTEMQSGLNLRRTSNQILNFQTHGVY